MSVVRYVRLTLSHALLSVSQSTFSFRLLISPFEQHMGFILILFFILYSFFIYLILLILSLPSIPLVGFPTPDERIGV
jgi:hypothetical protein